MAGKSRYQQGFSLLELMITITVALILLVIAVPSFRDVIHRNQVSSASNDVLASLAYARTEAITRGQLVSMCASADGATCTTPAGQAYDPGWIIYTYPASSTSAAANTAYSSTGSTLLRAIPARAGVSIQSKSTEIVTFGQQGQLDSATASPTLTFMTCYNDRGTATSTTAVPGAELNVNGSGSVRTTSLAAGASCTPP